MIYAQSGKTFLIQYEVNDACNLRCSHCYHGPKIIRKSPIAVQRLLEDLRELKTVLGPDYSISVLLSGGEVFVRKDLMQMLTELMIGGYATFVLTNGTLITPQNATDLLLRGVKLARISLDGGTPATHDHIRGQGQFHKTLEGMRHLLRNGQYVSANYTLMHGHNDSPAELQAMFALAAAEGIQSINFFRMFGQGDAKDVPQYSYKEGQSFKAVLEQLWDLAAQHPQIEVVVKDPLAKNLERARPANLNIDVCCYIKKDYLAVSANGDVYACRKLDQVLGNLLSDTLANIWQNSDLLTQLDQRKQYMQGKCRTCPINTECRGGCLAASYGEYGELFVPDPACWREESPLPEAVTAAVASV